MRLFDLVEDICVSDEDFAKVFVDFSCEISASWILMDEEDNLRDDLRADVNAVLSSEPRDKYLSCEDARACFAWYSTASCKKHPFIL